MPVSFLNYSINKYLVPNATIDVEQWFILIRHPRLSQLECRSLSSRNYGDSLHSHPFTTVLSLVWGAATFDLTSKHLDGVVTSSWFGLKQE
jgi:hypothetical protein